MNNNFFSGPEGNNLRQLSLANDAQYLLINTNSVQYLEQHLSEAGVSAKCVGEKINLNAPVCPALFWNEGMFFTKILN